MSDLTRQSTALLTDQYELTMVQAALESGRADRTCLFEVLAAGSLPADVTAWSRELGVS